MADLETRIGTFKALAGTLGLDGAHLRAALEAHDAIGQLSYRVWYYPSLTHDQDQRDNASAARRQRVQLLFARLEHATSWFNPELLKVPLPAIHAWMDADPALAVYRFAVDDLFRKQAHVLDHDGERLLSLASRLSGAPRDAYETLSTADAKFPTITLSSGATVQVTYGQYRRVLATSRVAADRRAAFDAHYDVFGATRNTYASLYNGVLHRDWFQARARGYATTLDAALFGDAIPPEVVTTLIAETKAGVEPFRRYHRLRKRVLGLAEYTAADAYVPLVEHDVQYRYDDVRAWIVESTARLGPDYQARVREAFDRRWIDVYENQGKRSGAYSAPVYGAHPVHAAELQRHARRRVHAGPRDGPLDAHAAGPRRPAVRLRRLHHLRRRGAVDAQRGAAARADARTRRHPRGGHRAAAARHRRHRRHLLQPGAVRRLRARGAPDGRARRADHRRVADRPLQRAARRLLGRRHLARRAARLDLGAASRTSTSRRTTSTSTRRAWPRRRP